MAGCAAPRADPLLTDGDRRRSGLAKRCPCHAVFPVVSSYEIVGHDRRRCTLQLRLDTSDPSTAPEPPFSQVRAERAITNLIGPTARVIGAELAGEELHAITVSHEVAEKLAAAGYRNRIERVVSTMMPGRWRAVWDLQGDSVRFELRPTLPASVWLPTPAAGPPR